MKQLDLFRDRIPPRISLTDIDRKFLETTPLAEIPDSLLIETRAQRMKCSVFDLKCMRSYSLAIEIADERAILGLGLRAFEISAPTQVDELLIEFIAKREAHNRQQEFLEFMRCR